MCDESRTQRHIHNFFPIKYDLSPDFISLQVIVAIRETLTVVSSSCACMSDLFVCNTDAFKACLLWRTIDCVFGCQKPL